ncbi:serine hydrolase domain-containing protein [Sphaerisporangium rubeum]|uniref:CubicO group peptidase (Beta-lactamase class C family) n=1 Tax=Sphaerisporangium rubeum TaxID=321317 RepID=A0A7X0IEV3_9ACTN|nr:serine hydrolase domain-containing protein [Sphaerisporangium rubeum]MBB6473866.1 CubicO group peptidase (beta-lactamase class C family) [Sphaerisporangium rubeum]
MVLEGTARALLRRVAAEQAEARVPSLAAAVLRDGAPVWSGTRGEVDGAPPVPGTQYRLGSITKSMVATLVMRLRDEGLLDLNDPLDKHLPGTPVGEVTVAQLLSHTGGLTAEPPGPWWERTPGVDPATLTAALDGTLKHRPGRRHHYSNLGYGLLGEVVARHRGVPWHQSLREEVLEPLGMRDTTTRPRAPHATGYAVHPYADVLLAEPEHDAAAMAPAGQLWSTLPDLCRWAGFVARGEGSVLAAATLAEMREPAVVEDGDAWAGGYGLGMQLLRHRGRRLAGHTGSMPGFLALVWADPADGTGVALLANTTSGLRPAVATDLLDILDACEPVIPAPWRPAACDTGLLELTGPWYWGPAPYVLRLRSGRELSLGPAGGHGRASRFAWREDGTWVGLEGYYAGETLRVVRRPDGTVSHLDVNTFVFTREPYDPAAPVPGGVTDDGWR